MLRRTWTVIAGKIYQAVGKKESRKKALSTQKDGQNRWYSTESTTLNFMTVIETSSCSRPNSEHQLWKEKYS